MAEEFPGFSADAVRFLDGLRGRNTRDYFEEHRAIYQRHILDPARLLVTDVGEQLRATVSPHIHADPRVGRSLFRINRDVRFSTDKTPYNPWIDIIWWEGNEDAARTAPAFIFRFSGDHLVVGAGIMAMRDQTLERYRRAVDDNTRGEVLAATLAEICETGGNIDVSGPTRKRVPAPYRADHPRGDLIRLDTIHASERLDHPAELATASFPHWLAEQQRRFAPLHRWLVTNLT